MNRHGLRRAAGAGGFSALSASLHITSTSATTTPSTVATPAILATLALRLMTFISMRRGVAGHHRLAEAGVFHGHQQHQLILAIGHGLQHQHTGRLRHGLDDQDARHHRKIGKMALEERLVGSHVLDSDYPVGLQFDDPVDQQERVAMGQNCPDFIKISKTVMEAVLSHAALKHVDRRHM
jgi:hypothetical protein